jgi:hypothetical protein
MYTYARGYIDNVRLTVPGPAETPVPTFGSVETETTVVTTRKTIALPTPLPTALPAETPESPMTVLPAVIALGILGTCVALRSRKKY